MTTVPASEAAYDALADAYDALTADYAHDEWLSALEILARRHGLQGSEVLDVACGTGKSFLPLAARGYEVTACDLSERMLDVARAKAPDGVRLFQADMRSLGFIGEFDLITCLDDSLNYLLTEEELAAALCGFRSNLAAGGLVLWDLNTLLMYRSTFASSWIVERGGFFLAWEGRTPADFRPRGLASAAVHVFTPRAGEDAWSRACSVHDQRHWTVPAVANAASAAGLELLSVMGQHPGAVIEPHLDELAHTKALFFARVRDERG